MKQVAYFGVLILLVLAQHSKSAPLEEQSSSEVASAQKQLKCNFLKHVYQNPKVDLDTYHAENKHLLRRYGSAGGSPVYLRDWIQKFMQRLGKNSDTKFNAINQKDQTLLVTRTESDGQTVFYRPNENDPMEVAEDTVPLYLEYRKTNDADICRFVTESMRGWGKSFTGSHVHGHKKGKSVFIADSTLCTHRLPNPLTWFPAFEEKRSSVPFECGESYPYEQNYGCEVFAKASRCDKDTLVKEIENAKIKAAADKKKEQKKAAAAQKAKKEKKSRSSQNRSESSSSKKYWIMAGALFASLTAMFAFLFVSKRMKKQNPNQAQANQQNPNEPNRTNRSSFDDESMQEELDGTNQSLNRISEIRNSKQDSAGQTMSSSPFANNINDASENIALRDSDFSLTSIQTPPAPYASNIQQGSTQALRSSSRLNSQQQASFEGMPSELNNSVDKSASYSSTRAPTQMPSQNQINEAAEFTHSQLAKGAAALQQNPSNSQQRIQ